MRAIATINKSRFDFESGYITKSPCRDCERANNLPYCSNNCRLLSQLQTRLIDTISSSNSLSDYEGYSLSLLVCGDF